MAELESARTEISDARIWNDLAAAYLVQAGAERGSYDLVRALAAAEQAVKEKPRAPQALFNRALILERLGLRATATRAWERYRAIDPASGWSREAALHLRSLAQRTSGCDEGRRAALLAAAMTENTPEVVRLAALCPEAARELASDELLPDWGKAFLRRDEPGAERALAATRALGRALQAAGGDQTVAGAVGAVERALAEPRRAEDLARAHLEYQLASHLYTSLRVEEAAPRLQRARGALERAGSPLASWAGSLLAGIDLARARPRQAQARLEELARRADLARAPALCGRLFWGLGLIRGREGRLTEALVYYGRSVEAFGRARETLDQAKVEALIAEALKYLGQTELAWAHLARALVVLETLPTSRELHGELWEAADVLLQDGQPGLALLFQQEDVEVARQSEQLFMKAEAQVRLSRVLAALRRWNEALLALQQARNWNSQGGSAATAEGTDAQIDLEEGEIRRQLDPATAIPFLDRALRHLLALRRPLEAPLAYLSRARTRLAMGNDRLAEEDLAAAIHLVGQAQTPIVEPAFRQSFAEGAQAFFEELILLRGRQANPELGTLEAMERARILASSLFSDQDGNRAPIDRLARQLWRLSSDVVVIEFSLIGDRLFRWELTREGAKLKVEAIDIAAFSRDVSRLVAAVRDGAGAEEISKASAPLYPHLVPTDGIVARPSARLVFVPDRLLNFVPFAALRDPHGTRYLIEDHCVSVAPSATAYLGLTARFAPPHPESWSALLVDDPEFDRDLFPQLARLGAKREETEEGRRLFAGSQVLAGKAATPSRLLQELSRHQIFGFAGHAVANDRYPLDSYLVLAPAAGHGEPGQLFARELAGQRFGALQLVVLSACQTVAATKGRGTGLSGLAWPFLDGGVSAVLATLWDVDDAEASVLIADFYRRFHASGDAAQALRESQLAALRGARPHSRPPAHWASFQLVGDIHPPLP